MEGVRYDVEKKNKHEITKGEKNWWFPEHIRSRYVSL